MYHKTFLMSRLFDMQRWRFAHRAGPRCQQEFRFAVECSNRFSSIFFSIAFYLHPSRFSFAPSLALPAHRPDKNTFVERYHRSYGEECLQRHRPATLLLEEMPTAGPQMCYDEAVS